ncbi:uncharacterized protein TRUGW13939_01370 [Talaromyces rugulosus]|uniref:4-hydroxy-2-oxoglutarate aldolase, mitochondrial n=1 Tax=Talaromyces rugulosus TaxID=121627 RepID=A0A7H8QLA3_TALRU|nr:uncharacterized protein TRUGW13939_01370 [Talaromyces rugulosus]QKX54285.1 hypothetical protein TRUGW13939_01370 [Talaromyces rugulosus]
MSTPHVPPAGVWVPVVTAFNHQSDTIDIDAHKKYCAYLSKYLTGLVILGTNAEAFLLTRDERAQAIRAAREAVGPTYPIMAGVGAHSTKQVLELSEDAAKAGANYLLVLPPAYFDKATTPSTVKRFFADVAAKASLPVVVYNFPGVTNGVDIDSDTIEAIVQASAAASPNGRSNVVGVKLTCAQVGKITRLTAAFGPDEFAVFGGQSDFLIGGLSVGSAGCIAAFANIAPKTISQIYRLYKEGKVEEALTLHRKAALVESPCKDGIAATKFAAAISSATRAGVEDPEDKFRPRTPYEEPGEAIKANVRKVMAEISAIDDTL